jgi:2-oxoisovalerate dehydrogenase E1 component beta subunit
MAVVNMIQALNDALRIEMKRDPKVILMGEDVGKLGGVFRVSLDLFKEFGPDRVIDTPLAEAGIIRTAIGMALYGLRPFLKFNFQILSFPHTIRSSMSSQNTGIVPAASTPVP